MAAPKGNSNSKKHGMSGTKIYRVWKSMRNRCKNANMPCYSNYGGRGISVCDEWKDFETFYKWAIHSGYKENSPRGVFTLDRIDNDGNYEPSNCRWVNMLEQANNKQHHIKITYKGVTKNVSEWAREYKINPSTLLSRIKSGWDIQDALTIPINPNMSKRKLVIK